MTYTLLLHCLLNQFIRLHSLQKTQNNHLEAYEKVSVCLKTVVTNFTAIV